MVSAAIRIMGIASHMALGTNSRSSSRMSATAGLPVAITATAKLRIEIEHASDERQDCVAHTLARAVVGCEACRKDRAAAFAARSHFVDAIGFARQPNVAALERHEGLEAKESCNMQIGKPQ